MESETYESPKKQLLDDLDEIEETKEEENISDQEISFHLRLMSSNSYMKLNSLENPPVLDKSSSKRQKSKFKTQDL